MSTWGGMKAGQVQPITSRNSMAPTSFIELELFQAVLLDKPIIYLFVGKNRNASKIYQLVQQISASLVVSECCGTVAHAVDRLIEFVESPGDLRLTSRKSWSNSPITSLTSSLARARHKDWNNKNLFDEPEFLNGRPLRFPGTHFDLELIGALLDQLDGETRTNRILSRAWIAIRSLMHAHYSNKQETRIALLWNRALSHWSSAAAWRGLHAHLWLGNVCVLGSLVRTRAINDLPSFDFARENYADLHNALGSVYYSLSKKVEPTFRDALLYRSEAYVEKGLSQQENQFHAGLLPLKGSIQLRRWRPILASKTFGRALDLLDMNDADNGEKGMVLTELGWAEVCSGRLISGRSKLKEGLQMMECTKINPGFIVRAKRKHIVASALNLRFLEAIALLSSVRDQVIEDELLDQGWTFFSLEKWFGRG